jgi:hypothetical protein
MVVSARCRRFQRVDRTLLRYLLTTVGLAAAPTDRIVFRSNREADRLCIPREKSANNESEYHDEPLNIASLSSALFNAPRQFADKWLVWQVLTLFSKQTHRYISQGFAMFFSPNSCNDNRA